MYQKAFNDFIIKISNDEVFRSEVVADPKSVINSCGLNKDEIESIKTGQAWAWLRELWASPIDW